MYVECTEADEVKTLDKNFKEITDAVAAGMYVVMHQRVIEGAEDAEFPVDFYYPLSTTAVFNGTYSVYFGSGSQGVEFTADSETDPLIS